LGLRFEILGGSKNISSDVRLYQPSIMLKKPFMVWDSDWAYPREVRKRYAQLTAKPGLLVIQI